MALPSAGCLCLSVSSPPLCPTSSCEFSLLFLFFFRVAKTPVMEVGKLLPGGNGFESLSFAAPVKLGIMWFALKESLLVSNVTVFLLIV